MYTTSRKLMIGVAISALTLVGCDQAQRPQQMADNGDQRPARELSPKSASSKPTDSVVQAVDDAAITAKVKTALAADKDVKSSDISVKTTQGRVVLTGQVPDPAQVKLAEQKVAQIDGVQGVDNRLQPK